MHRGAPEDARPHEVLLLILVCAIVPLVWLAAMVTGSVRLATMGSVGTGGE